MNGARILVVDDDAGHLDVMCRVFAHERYQVGRAASAEEAIEALRGASFDVIVTDLMMPGLNGVELLKMAKLLQPMVEVIVMTAFGTVERAVEAMKEGAFDFIEKPVKRAPLVRSVGLALERKRLLAENVVLKRELRSLQADRQLIGRSESMLALQEMLRQVAPTQATVLIAGPSGTGKELVARAVHELSGRSERAFVALNCAALPASILESELFGHEKGAFTGAHQRKAGRFELADGGSLFLDEIGEMPLEMQAKLLRVLQEGEFERVGGTRALRVDVRIIAATNKQLEEEVLAGRFREDLFYRLNVIALELPPLCRRPDDIPLLVEHFLRGFAQTHGRRLEGISRSALEVLMNHSWPGNVRELRNVLERAVVLSPGPLIDVSDLPAGLGSMRGASGRGRELVFSVGTPLEQVKQRLVLETLKATGGDKQQAAALLDIAPRTIYRVLERVARGDASSTEDGD
ncbi:MAG: sigma-54 dependent transcriptional regulator [Myxococcota bacterium]|nr:sigma-54 dependent transcriptional regulator [Myxococcota bacterium]